VLAFFNASTYTVPRNGRSTTFWTERWIQGQAVKDVTPSLLDFVSQTNIKATIVAVGLTGRAWVRQIPEGITVSAILDYLRVWDLVSQIQLGNGEDKLI
jgi:hypothetical protein